MPVILNVYDAYMFGANGCDLAVDVEEAVPADRRDDVVPPVADREWLPWVGRHDMAPPGPWPSGPRDCARGSIERIANWVCAPPRVGSLRVTAWGEVPTLAQLTADLPTMFAAASNLSALEQRLRQWRHA